MTQDCVEGPRVHIDTIRSSQMLADTRENMSNLHAPLLLLNIIPPNSTQSPPPDSAVHIRKGRSQCPDCTQEMHF